jgi:hypothetical protein
MRRDAAARVAGLEAEDREVVLGRDLVEAPLVVGVVAGVAGVLAGHLGLAVVAGALVALPVLAVVVLLLGAWGLARELARELARARERAREREQD